MHGNIYRLGFESANFCTTSFTANVIQALACLRGAHGAVEMFRFLPTKRWGAFHLAEIFDWKFQKLSC